MATEKVGVSALNRPRMVPTWAKCSVELVADGMDQGQAAY